MGNKIAQIAMTMLLLGFFILVGYILVVVADANWVGIIAKLLD